MRTDKVFNWLIEWIESTEVDSFGIENLDQLKDRLDNTFGTRYDALNLIMGSIETIFTDIQDQMDIVISKERKGTKIFHNYLRIKGVEMKHVPFDLIKEGIIKNKKVVIFDDGIHYGDTGKDILDRVISSNPEQIIFYSVIATIEALNKLRAEFPDVEFIVSESVPNADYTTSYNRLFYRIFDILPFPLDDHLEYNIIIETIHKPVDIIKALSHQINTNIYHVPTLRKEELEIIKGTILFDTEEINKIINQDFKIEMYKIRFYIYYIKGKGIQFTFTPVLQLSHLDIEKCMENDFVHKLCEYLEKNGRSCLDCYEINLTQKLFIPYIKEFINRITKAKIHIVKFEKNWDKMVKYGLSPD